MQESKPSSWCSLGLKTNYFNHRQHWRIEVGLAYRKRIRIYGTTNHFIHLGTQLWEKDWQIYDKPRVRVDTWAKIQLFVFTSARVGKYIESTCRAGSGRGLYYRVSTLCKTRCTSNGREYELRWPRVGYDLWSHLKRTRKSRVRHPSRAGCEGYDLDAEEKVRLLPSD